MPVITLIDTPGAYPGIDSEERGISEAIAQNLAVMSRLKTQVICVVIGEGSSGGALGIGVGDHLAMFQYATYFVISPEGCANIIWKSSEYAAGRGGRHGCYIFHTSGTGYCRCDNCRAIGGCSPQRRRDGSAPARPFGCGNSGDCARLIWIHCLPSDISA